MAYIRRYNVWRLALAVFLVIYTIVLLIELDYAAILWDETPHFYSGLLLSRGQFQEYAQVEAFYPPLFNAITGFFFTIFGTSVFSARLVPVAFSVLSVWVTFEFGYKLYSPRTGFLASVFLAAMPSVLWLSRLAMIETMLMFFFTVSLLSFFYWLKTNSNKMLVLTGVILGLGFLVKYQAAIAGLIMLISLVLAGKKHFLTKGKQFFFILVFAGLVILPWTIIVYQSYAMDMVQKWLYVMQMGNDIRLAYSARFFTPIFYLIEMTIPYVDLHPISFPVYLFSLSGLVLWLKRRTESDKFALLSFVVVYVVFTLITSKDWRYVTLIFPVLAVSASEFVLFLWDKIENKPKTPHIDFRGKTIKILAVVLVLCVGLSVVYSSWEGYVWIEKDNVQVPIGDATQYVFEKTTVEDEIIVLCSGNYFSADMVEFYLLISDSNRRQPVQYPDLPVDAYIPSFNVTELIEISQDLDAKYLLLFEHGNATFYESELTSNKILQTILETNRFSVEQTFGAAPRRIYILQFLSES